MRIDPKMLDRKDQVFTHVVRHVQSDCAVAAFSDEQAAADDARDRYDRAKALGVRAEYEVQPLRFPYVAQG